MEKLCFFALGSLLKKGDQQPNTGLSFNRLFNLELLAAQGFTLK